MHRKYVLSRFALKTHACHESRCKVISHVSYSPNVYPQDRAFDCAHIASDCNDRAIQTAENKKSRLRSISLKSRDDNSVGYIFIKNHCKSQVSIDPRFTKPFGRLNGSLDIVELN